MQIRSLFDLFCPRRGMLLYVAVRAGRGRTIGRQINMSNKGREMGKNIEGKKGEGRKNKNRKGVVKINSA